ncbi:histidinol-phosphatase (PHP family) [Paenibacillus jilunlii]|uniref:Histidinol-phosphatase n=1 Tax=Paenibacillus jilunlii TaxID=682956 RepID=A0A1G9W2Q7_9BACL|nr:histidinol-phosphatase (PHP family) [Paenibacillus jilunlii]
MDLYLLLEGHSAKSEFPAYIAEVLALKKEFAGRIAVMLGIEADFLPQSLELYREIIAGYPFDYVIGSIHDFGGISIYASCNIYLRIANFENLV